MSLPSGERNKQALLNYILLIIGLLFLIAKLPWEEAEQARQLKISYKICARSHTHTHTQSCM